jgi:lysylphosphatidylglycerol synthetase-like protein (DUF2156 family)
MKKKIIKHLSNKDNYLQYGTVIFIISIILAAVLAILRTLDLTSNLLDQFTFITLLILGFAIGLLNISRRESVAFLLAVMFLVMLGATLIQASYNFFSMNLSLLGFFYTNIVSLAVPAGLVVAIKILFSTAKDEN